MADWFLPLLGAAATLIVALSVPHHLELLRALLRYTRLRRRTRDETVKETPPERTRTLHHRDLHEAVVAAAISFDAACVVSGLLGGLHLVVTFIGPVPQVWAHVQWVRLAVRPALAATVLGLFAVILINIHAVVFREVLRANHRVDETFAISGDSPEAHRAAQGPLHKMQMAAWLSWGCLVSAVPGSWVLAGAVLA